MEVSWPHDAEQLHLLQRELARAADDVEAWRGAPRPVDVGGVFVAFASGIWGRGSAGDAAVAAAVVLREGSPIATAVARGLAGAPYEPGLMALREGALLEAAVRALGSEPDVLLVNATGRDHPRGAGLALHLGAVLGLPTVGVTDRSLVAVAGEPAAERGATAPLEAGDRLVGQVVRTRTGVRPVLAHAAWRTTPDVAADVVLDACGRARTPEPLRQARRLARITRAQAWQRR